MLSLRRLLDVRALGLRSEHLPWPDADVRWVATSELSDPVPFLEGGEVLLTTGLETPRWRSTEWTAYVRRLSEARVSALGLGVGLTHQQVPEALRTACEQYRLNLVAVPRPTTFVAVSRTAARLLEAAERDATRVAVELQRDLTRAALRTGDTVAILRCLGAGLHGAGALVARDGGIVEGPYGSDPTLLDPAATAREVKRMRPRGLRAAVGTIGATTTLLVHAIGVHGRPSSYLAVAVPGRLSATERDTVTTAVALLSLSAERRTSRRDVDRRLRSRAVDLLLVGDPDSARLLMTVTDPQLTQPLRRLVAVRAVGPATRLEEALEQVEADQRHPLAGLVSEQLVVLVTPRQARPVASAMGTVGIRVGVGSAAPAREVGRSHVQAGHALATTTSSAPIAFWDDNVAAGAVSLLDPARAAAFADSFLGPLRGEREAELLSTLQSFLRHHGSQARVARELGVHRNTVAHRLHLIEAGIGRSLDDPQVRVDAWLALQTADAL